MSSRVAFAAAVAWSLLCAGAFAALGGAEDPSRPEGRISPYKAEIIALEHLRTSDPVAWARFETVDSAMFRDRDRGRLWLVLCDDERPSRLARAVVVEIDAASGRVVRVRRPGGADLAEVPR